ncbi:MAG TPA: sensor histidine kinase [Candidatus Limnocylindrales bacterium]|nr:sensor histidine kinase [Candidatus Limnocylindrales bacterium]
MQGMGEWIRRIAAWPDLFTAAAIALILGGLLEGRFWAPSGIDSDTFKALSLCATLPILVSRRHLVMSAIVVSGATVAFLSISGRPAISVLIGQYWIVHLVAARTTRAWTGVALLPLIGNAIYPYSGTDAVLSAVLILIGAVAVAAMGDFQRQAKRAIAERNAAREETAQARHDRAVLAERSRIARELHDVVAHHVSMMVVQAETARVGTPGLGAEGSKSLEVIRDTGRQALTEMRRVVGVLRRDPSPDEPIVPADRSPQPGLDRIDDLVAAARAAGTPVMLQRDVRPPALPAMVELCGYRIIQEALTNVRRHAPGASVEVVVRVTDRALHIRVTDNGPGADPVARQGHGLVGMRERAAMVGGRLRAGPLATGGFLVEAELPSYGTALMEDQQQK